MTCTNCRKAITGKAHDHSGTRAVNGSGIKRRAMRVVYCGGCEQQVAEAMKASSERHARELRELAERLGVTLEVTLEAEERFTPK